MSIGSSMKVNFQKTVKMDKVSFISPTVRSSKVISKMIWFGVMVFYCGEMAADWKGFGDKTS